MKVLDVLLGDNTLLEAFVDVAVSVFENVSELCVEDEATERHKVPVVRISVRVVVVVAVFNYRELNLCLRMLYHFTYCFEVCNI